MRLSLLALLFLLAGCQINERADAIVELAPDLTNGEALYELECARCHASDARGNDLGPNLVAELYHGDKLLITYILDGTNNGEMPAFGDDFTDQDTADVMGWIHALAEQ